MRLPPRTMNGGRPSRSRTKTRSGAARERSTIALRGLTDRLVARLREANDVPGARERDALRRARRTPRARARASPSRGEA